MYATYPRTKPVARRKLFLKKKNMQFQMNANAEGFFPNFFETNLFVLCQLQYDQPYQSAVQAAQK